MPVVPCAGYIIGVDPGTLFMGVALFKGDQFLEACTLKASRGKDVDERVYLMLKDLATRVWPIVFCPNCSGPHVQLAYEDPSFRRFQSNATTIDALFRCVGHLDQWARACGFAVYKYAVNDIKDGVAGRQGRAVANKQEVEIILRHELGLHEVKLSNHAWDAISVVVYHLAQKRIQSATGD